MSSAIKPKGLNESTALYPSVHPGDGVEGILPSGTKYRTITRLHHAVDRDGYERVTQQIFYPPMSGPTFVTLSSQYLLDNQLQEAFEESNATIPPLELGPPRALPADTSAIEARVSTLAMNSLKESPKTFAPITTVHHAVDRDGFEVCTSQRVWNPSSAVPTYVFLESHSLPAEEIPVSIASSSVITGSGLVIDQELAESLTRHGIHFQHPIEHPPAVRTPAMDAQLVETLARHGIHVPRERHPVDGVDLSPEFPKNGPIGPWIPIDELFSAPTRSGSSFREKTDRSLWAALNGQTNPDLPVQSENRCLNSTAQGATSEGNGMALRCGYKDPEGIAGDHSGDQEQTGYSTGNYDNRSYYLDGFPRTDWSRDPRWQQAEWERLVGEVYRQGAMEHFDEACSSLASFRPFESKGEYYAAIRDELIAIGRFSEANRLENQIAQDAVQERKEHEERGCSIC